MPQSSRAPDSNSSNNSLPCLAHFQTRAAKGFAVLSLVFVLIFIPIERLATREGNLVRRCRPSPSPGFRPEFMLILARLPAPAFDRIRYIGQGTTEATGLFLADRPRACWLTCQSMMA